MMPSLVGNPIRTVTLTQSQKSKENGSRIMTLDVRRQGFLEACVFWEGESLTTPQNIGYSFQNIILGKVPLFQEAQGG